MTLIERVRGAWADYRVAGKPMVEIAEKYGFSGRQQMYALFSAAGLVWRRRFGVYDPAFAPPTCPADGAYCGKCGLALPIPCTDRKCRHCLWQDGCPCWTEAIRNKEWEKKYDAWLTHRLRGLDKRKGGLLKGKIKRCRSLQQLRMGRRLALSSCVAGTSICCGGLRLKDTNVQQARKLKERIPRRAS